MSSPVPAAWPPADAGRLARAVTALAGRVETEEARVQLQALAAILRNLGCETAAAEERAALAARLASALEREDEADAVPAMRMLARLDREALRPVAWAAGSGD